ncbi:hypothetical protein OIU78_002605 [Salix suchowensis]|nr:hypothetical protein OIU78_002605 [Salix suchowensis]
MIFVLRCRRIWKRFKEDYNQRVTKVEVGEWVRKMVKLRASMGGRQSRWVEKMRASRGGRRSRWVEKMRASREDGRRSKWVDKMGDKANGFGGESFQRRWETKQMGGEDGRRSK